MTGKRNSIGLTRRIGDRLFEPVDISALVYFRVAFGAVLLWEVCRYFTNGWIRPGWIEPVIHFKYYGFSWVEPWPGVGMYVHFGGLGLLCLLILLGMWYRAAMILFFLGFTYVFLLEQALYLNHFYFISLLSFLMVFVPAHHAFSVDARRRPELRSMTAPAWSLWMLRAQIGIVYFYGGLSKLSEDWLLRGEPMRSYLAPLTDSPVVGPLLAEEAAVHFFAFGGFLFDLLIVPFLLWRRTRLPAFLLAVFFHVMNAWIFRIGIFPWLMLAGTALFFEPDWPRRVLRLAKIGRQRDSAIGVTSSDEESGKQQAREQFPPSTRRATLALAAGYLAIQLLVPLRHYLYPGDVSWTLEGDRFAWRMKLNKRSADAVFRLTDPATNESWIVRPRDHLQNWQARMVSVRPDMTLQFSHYLAELERAAGRKDIEVRALVMVSLNDHPPQPLIDHWVDLAAERRSLAPAHWVLSRQGTRRPGLVGGNDRSLR